MGHCCDIPDKGACHNEQGDDLKEAIEARDPLFVRFVVALLLTILILLGSFSAVPPLGNPAIQLTLSLIVYGIGVYHFGKSALRSVIRLSPNMNVLILTGATAAFGYSILAMFNSDAGYMLHFDTAATIITFVLLGSLIERRALYKTRNAVYEISKLQSKSAIKLEGESEVHQVVPVSDLKVGDIVLVKDGETIPADGEIIWGEGEVDESIITGESGTQLKKRGDVVIGGTLLVHGTIKVSVTAEAEAGMLSRIKSLILEAEKRKPQIQVFGDRISAKFVPMVLVISVITFVGWMYLDGQLTSALMNAIAVLVVACPCAMGLATPTAVSVIVGKAARRGILIKGGDVFERLISTDTFVFDKTGTLTTGDLDVKNGIVVKSMKLEELLRILKGLESYSTHPIARWVVHSLKDIEKEDFESVNEIKGSGIQGKTKEGDVCAILSRRAVESSNIDPSMAMCDIFIEKNGYIVGGFSIKEKIREHAKEVVEFLKQRGKRVLILSGDLKEKVRVVAEELGVHEWHAEMLPDEKLEKIRELQKSGRSICFVGDGVNDAPALSIANVGISLGSGSATAISASQIVLLTDSLEGVMLSYYISELGFATIKQNLFWALIYNVVAIPAAALGYLSPMLGALSMAFSDVIVVGNSLRVGATNLDRLLKQYRR